MKQAKDYTNKIITIPNILSFVRLCLIPFIVWFYCARPFDPDYLNSMLTILVYGLSGLTDIVDGTIARKFNMISNFGKIFDPVADKLTQIAVIACLINDYWYMTIPLVIFVLKEVGMNVVGLVAAKKTGVIKGANWHGKVNTVVFFGLMVIHLAWSAIPPVTSYVFVAICVAMMLTSALLYTLDYIKMLKQAKEQEK